MIAIAEPAEEAVEHTGGLQKRFDRVAVSSIFGNPLDRRTWSAAPYNIARCMKDFGIAVEGIHSGGSRGELALLASRYSLSGYGTPRSGEAVLRTAAARRKAADRLAAILKQRKIEHVIHTGSLDMLPSAVAPDIRHYIYCDHTWALSLLHRPDLASYSSRAIEAFELLERESLASAEHIFTFGAYVRDHIIDHYGIPGERVTAVGSGMGDIEPYSGPKDYTRPRLLFVAKHLFAAKGGVLLLEAFRIARRQRPDLQLTIVGDERSRRFIPAGLEVDFRAHLPLPELQRLFREASLLAQPMLNDPWGQVYLEALRSRTPVLGLNRNGLPEITGNGRYGFLVDAADPQILADAILQAMADPQRLADMGESGQQHVLQSYSWEIAARRMAYL